MKLKLSLVLAACLASSSAFAAKKEDTISKLQSQLELIQKEINALKEEQSKNNKAVKAELADLQERSDANEFASGLDKIRFGLDFSTGVSNTYSKQLGDKANALNKWAGELNLNMNADVSEYVKFYGRLSMARYWGQLGSQFSGKPIDLDSGRNPATSGTALYVTRAYVDIFATPELIFTIGRQPGTEGPGSNLRNNALRQSTYPALFLNTLGDAAIVTYKPSALSDYAFAGRVGYGKVYQWDETDGEVRDWISGKETADSTLYYGSAEARLPLDSIGLGNNLAVVSYVRLQDFSLPIDNGLLNSFLARGANVYDLGNADIANIHFEAYNVAGSGFNYFTSFGYYKGSDRRQIELASTKQAVAIAPQIQRQLRFNEKDAWSVHIGGRYDFTQSLKLGAEYFYGSRYWYTMSRPSINDPLNIRMTRGHAADLYGIWQFDRNQFVRLSYTYIKNLWGNRSLPFGGAAKKIDGVSQESTANNIMFMYNLKY